MNNDPNLYEGQKLVKDANGFFMKMYGYMAAAVGISAVTAFMAANVPSVVSSVQRTRDEHFVYHAIGACLQNVFA